MSTNENIGYAAFFITQALKKMCSATIDIILPVYLEELEPGEEFHRVECLLQTFLTRFNRQDFNMFVIISPTNQIARVITLLKKYPALNATLRTDEDLVPWFTLTEAKSGWHKQMLLKLAATAQSNADFAFILDSDILFVRQSKKADLLREGRARYWQTNISTEDKWWTTAATTIDNPDVFSRKLGMGVTPQLLSTDIVRLLARYLTRKNNKSWIEHLTEHLYAGWTEYTLYFTFADKCKIFDLFHVTQGSEEPILVSRHNIWHAATLDSRWIEKVIAEDPVSVVFQSNTQIPVSQVREACKVLFENSSSFGHST